MKSISKIEMQRGPVLVFGGPYSNLQATKAVFDFSVSKGIKSTNIICTGDVVGYCAQPAETLEFIQKWGIHVIRGNVETQLLDNEDDCGCNFVEGGRCDLFSKTWFPYAKARVGITSLQWISQLPDLMKFDYAGKKVTVIHGGLSNNAEYIFKSTNKDTKAKVLKMLETDIVLAGHCGLPFVDKVDQGLWLNAGVIGMPANDGSPQVWCLVLYDEPDFRYEFYQMNYDALQASKLMIDNDLIPSYAETLVTGIWDNCEILPPLEAKSQGKPIAFKE